LFAGAPSNGADFLPTATDRLDDALEGMDYSGGLLLQRANLSELAVCGSGLIDKICERFIGLRSLPAFSAQ